MIFYSFDARGVTLRMYARIPGNLIVFPRRMLLTLYCYFLQTMWSSSNKSLERLLKIVKKIEASNSMIICYYFV